MLTYPWIKNVDILFNQKIIMDGLPLLYYLKYFILHVDYKLLQSYVFIKRICFWRIKNKRGRLLQDIKQIVCFWQGLSIVWVQGKKLVTFVCNSRKDLLYWSVTLALKFLYRKERFEFIAFIFYAKNKAFVHGRCNFQYLSC